MKRRWQIPALMLTALVAASVSDARAQSPTDITVTDIRVSPRRVRPGGVVRVSMTLFNGSALTLRSQPPAPSTVYAQGESFTDRGFTAQPDRFHIVMTPSGPRGDEWPWRWGIGGDLPLGQRRRVSYPVRLTTPGIYTLFVGIAVGDTVRRLPAPTLTGIEVIAPGRGRQTRPGLIEPTPPTRITVNGQEVALDQRPIFADATVLVPVRFVMEALGATVDWRPRNRTVRATRGEYDLTLRIGQRYHTSGGREVYTYTPPRIVRGRTMVPLRFVTEALGGTVAWDDRTRTVIINAPPPRETSAR